MARFDRSRWLMLSSIAAFAAFGGCAAEVLDGEELAEDEIGLLEEQLATGFMLKNTNTGRCLAATTVSGDNASLAVCDANDVKQRWGFDGGFLKHSPDGLCFDLEAASLADGAPAQVFSCNGRTNQDFRFYPVASHAGTTVNNWRLVVRHSSKCIGEGSGNTVVQSGNCFSAWNVVF